MKYIDAEKLIAEIERRESEIKSQIAELGNFESNEIGLFNYLGLYDDILSIITSLQQEHPGMDLEKAAEEYAYTNWESKDYHEGASEGLPFDPIGHTAKCFKAGAERQREQYECIPAEEAYMRGFAQGAKEERKDLTPLINRLCEAILFEWKDAADLARKILIQIKAQEE